MVKRYAKVAAGIVEHISVANRSEDAPGCVELDDVADESIGIGDLHDGNVFSKRPLPPKTPEQLAKEAQQATISAAKAEAQADNAVQYLRDHTPAECEQYVQDTVTDLASAKAFLKKVAIVLCALSKESLR